MERIASERRLATILYISKVFASRIYLPMCYLPERLEQGEAQHRVHYRVNMSVSHSESQVLRLMALPDEDFGSGVRGALR
jgi:hypothetical protein